VQRHGITSRHPSSLADSLGLRERFQCSLDRTQRDLSGCAGGPSIAFDHVRWGGPAARDTHGLSPWGEPIERSVR
jgi:hypothetical protein